ncbi:hypothetical protein BY458DRAFT_549799 [Sporodiniella umbellata]|nr:hypothetical protein BY458DRAFT_549799 [Sporodiniella umbellata]
MQNVAQKPCNGNQPKCCRHSCIIFQEGHMNTLVQRLSENAFEPRFQLVFLLDSIPDDVGSKYCLGTGRKNGPILHLFYYIAYLNGAFNGFKTDLDSPPIIRLYRKHHNQLRKRKHPRQVYKNNPLLVIKNNYGKGPGLFLKQYK